MNTWGIFSFSLNFGAVKNGPIMLKLVDWMNTWGCIFHFFFTRH